jgi:hypothetical protein
MKSKNSVDRIYQLRQLFPVTPEISKQRDEKLPRKLKSSKLNNLEQNKAA